MPRKHRTLQVFTPGRGYTKEDWDAVDSPELTEEELATARPFKEVFPDLYAKIKRGRPPSEAPKKQVTLRLDQEVIDKFRATGKGWQSRINEVLKKAEV
mgnify:CR=1 FL=1